MDALKSALPRTYASEVKEAPALLTVKQHKERDDTRWAAVVARDRAASVEFVYAVATTGVYCRPGCASRRPRRENVAFFDTPAAARAAGYRPCARCRPDATAGPDGRMTAIVSAACRAIDAAEETPTLAALAAAAGMSPSHFHRVFKREVGVTPKAYAAARRAHRARALLAGSASVTDAIYAAGYSTSSRFYDEAASTLGMTPTQFRDGGADVAMHVAVARCDLGWVLVAATARGICAIELGDSERALRAGLARRFPKARLIEGNDGFAASVEAVVALLESPGRGLALPLDIRGTAFQRRVWEALRAIPPGETLTYEEVAARIGAPKAARAVAGACAANALAVAIPCHRIVRADGGVGGYRWGVDRKRALLAREGARTAERGTAQRPEGAPPTPRSPSRARASSGARRTRRRRSAPSGRSRDGRR